MSHPLPESTSRLFAHYPVLDSGDPQVSGLVIGRVLEEGDRSDLDWLCRSYREDELRAWVVQHGERQLSRRSRIFWRWVLGVDTRASEMAENPLWPL